MGGGATVRVGFATLIASVALIASVVLIPSWSDLNAQTLIPADIGQRLQAAISQSDIYRQQTTQTGASLGNAALARTYRENAQHNADTTISAAVVAEIARQPRLARAIIARAVQLAPASQTAIINASQAAFPGYVAQGAGAASFLGVPQTTLRPQVVGGFATTFPRFTGTTPQFAAAPAARVANQQQSSDGEPAAIGGGSEEINDPIESVNRAIFAFNDVVDTFTLRPVAALYSYATPEVARVAVRRAVRNLNAPVVLVNDLLQLDPVGAGVTTGRFLINSTAGILGLFDVASLVGLDEHHADFGQTLHSYGLGPGPYVVLPILGPSTTRDATGRVVDIFFDPLTYILEGNAAIGVAAGRGLIRREEVLDPLEKLRANSVDYYAALRAAYYQKRAVQLGLSVSGGSNVDTLFDSAE